MNKKISYDFDGVLHVSVTKPDPNGQIHPLRSVMYLANKLIPNMTVINLIKKQIDEGIRIYIITHRTSKQSFNVIKKFLSRTDIGLNNIKSNDIYLVYGNKGNVLNKHNIKTHYDDSINVLNAIKEKYSNIKLNLVNPYNFNINQYY